jgi:hypothetical protein
VKLVADIRNCHLGILVRDYPHIHLGSHIGWDQRFDNKCGDQDAKTDWEKQ